MEKEETTPFSSSEEKRWKKEAFSVLLFTVFREGRQKILFANISGSVNFGTMIIVIMWRERERMQID